MTLILMHYNHTQTIKQENLNRQQYIIILIDENRLKVTKRYRTRASELYLSVKINKFELERMIMV